MLIMWSLTAWEHDVKEEPSDDSTGKVHIPLLYLVKDTTTEFSGEVITCQSDSQAEPFSLAYTSLTHKELVSQGSIQAIASLFAA